MSKFLSSILIAAIAVSGCATTGERTLTPEGQAILDTSLRIAVRHAVADSPRAAEKARNIRAIAVRLQAVTSAESTLAGLTAEVRAEIDKLPISALDKADANDLLTLLAVSLESRLGSDALQSAGLVKVNEFLTLVLEAIPAV